MRDFQKKKVYKWEDKVIKPRSSRIIPFEQAQAFVNGIWLAHGWLYPPKVGLMAKHATKVWANGNREQINLRQNTPAWVILHELAHTLTMDENYNGDRHGPEFVGAYIKLLESVLGIPAIMLIYTLDQAGVKYDWTKPFGPGQNRSK